MFDLIVEFLELVSIVQIKILNRCYPISIGVTFITFVLEVVIIFSYVHQEQFSMKQNKAVWIDSMERIVMEHVRIINQR